jgi:hypothetical protein
MKHIGHVERSICDETYRSCWEEYLCKITVLRLNFSCCLLRKITLSLDGYFFCKYPSQTWYICSVYDQLHMYIDCNTIYQMNISMECSELIPESDKCLLRIVLFIHRFMNGNLNLIQIRPMTQQLCLQTLSIYTKIILSQLNVQER